MLTVNQVSIPNSQIINTWYTASYIYLQTLPCTPMNLTVLFFWPEMNLTVLACAVFSSDKNITMKSILYILYLLSNNKIIGKITSWYIYIKDHVIETKIILSSSILQVILCCKFSLIFLQYSPATIVNFNLLKNWIWVFVCFNFQVIFLIMHIIKKNSKFYKV